MTRSVHGLFVMLAAAGILVSAPATGRGQGARDLDRRIRDNQQRLEALQRQERALRQQVSQLEKQLPGARDKLKKSEGELKDNEKSLDAAKEKVEKAKASVKSLNQQLAEITKRIEEGQPEASALAKARTAYLAAKKAYADAVTRIENSAEYKAAYEKAVDSPNRTELMPQVRKKWIDEDAAVAESRGKLLEAKSIYEGLLNEMLRKDSGWVDASDSLQRARKEQDDGQQELRNLSGKVTTARRSFTKLQADAKRMEDALPRAKSELQDVTQKRDALRRQIDSDRRALLR